MSEQKRPDKKATPQTAKPIPRSRARFRTLAALAGGIVSISAVVAALLVFVVAEGGDSDPPAGPTAVIVDQLDLTAPNPEFAEAATKTLEEAGYVVEYVPGAEVTVDFYRELPDQGYDMVILRSHSARLQSEFAGEPVDEVILFTNEGWTDQKYVSEQETGQLTTARYNDEGERYFGVAPSFIEESAQGSFDGTTIVLMGCEGLGSERTAEVFVRKGAQSVISWDGLVSATHTDAATEELLELMLLGQLPAAEAVAETMTSVGPDPTYGSKLLSLPAN